MSTYTAVCERVRDWWEITVPEIGSVTQVKHLDDVEETVRDLVVLMADVEPADVSVNVRPPAGAS